MTTCGGNTQFTNLNITNDHFFSSIISKVVSSLQIVYALKMLCFKYKKILHFYALEIVKQFYKII
jgi:hypothetical protein